MIGCSFLWAKKLVKFERNFQFAELRVDFAESGLLFAEASIDIAELYP